MYNKLGSGQNPKLNLIFYDENKLQAQFESNMCTKRFNRLIVNIFCFYKFRDLKDLIT